MMLRITHIISKRNIDQQVQRTHSQLCKASFTDSQMYLSLTLVYTKLSDTVIVIHIYMYQ